MTTSPLADPVSVVESPPTSGLAVVLRKSEDGPELTRESLTAADLLDARAELWLREFLRRGRPDVPLSEVRPEVIPLLSSSQARCTGFALETIGPHGEPARCEFSIHAVEPAVVRAAQRLRKSGQLADEDTYTYELVPHRAPSAVVASAKPSANTAMNLSVTTAALRYQCVPLPALLERARQVGELDERWFPVFYTEAAYAKAERFARKGGRQTPAVETGAVLTGPLCACPETGEMYAVVHEPLEVLDADEQEFSLTYSGASWQKIQAVIRARQSRSETAADRILGQCHGHNFPPAGGAPPCDICSQVEHCTRTSVFVSQADRTWSRAVLGGQPWQLCHIFGANARGEMVQKLFGLRDGRLMERGFYIVPDFSGK